MVRFLCYSSPAFSDNHYAGLTKLDVGSQKKVHLSEKIAGGIILRAIVWEQSSESPRAS